MPWRPIREKHAIDRVTISFFFEDELPMKIWQPIVSKLSQRLLEEGFVPSSPPLAPQMAMGGKAVFQINFGPSGAQVAPQTDVLQFQLSTNGTLVEEVVFSRQFIVYTTTNYSRWNDLKNRVYKLSGEQLADVFGATNLQTLKLEYWDRFLFDGKLNQVDYSALLKAESTLVPSFPRKTTALWHTHVGFFVPSKESPRRLINANLDALDQAFPVNGGQDTSRILGIYTMAEDRFESAPASIDGVDSLFLIADEMHLTLKEIFGDIINSEMADLVSLQAAQEQK